MSDFRKAQEMIGQVVVNMATCFTGVATEVRRVDFGAVCVFISPCYGYVVTLKDNQWRLGTAVIRGRGENTRYGKWFDVDGVWRTGTARSRGEVLEGM